VCVLLQVLLSYKCISAMISRIYSENLGFCTTSNHSVLPLHWEYAREHWTAWLYQSNEGRSLKQLALVDSADTLRLTTVEHRSFPKATVLEPFSLWLDMGWVCQARPAVFVTSRQSGRRTGLSRRLLWEESSNPCQHGKWTLNRWWWWWWWCVMHASLTNYTTKTASGAMSVKPNTYLKSTQKN